MRRRRSGLGSVVLVAILAASCGGGSAASPSAAGSPAATSGAEGPVASGDEAAARVIAREPRFMGIGPKDPDLIGGCCWYEVAEDEGGYLVTIEMGWGDCPAGCSNRHVWTYAVTRGGDVGLIGETGDAIPPGEFPPSGG